MIQVLYILNYKLQVSIHKVSRYLRVSINIMLSYGLHFTRSSTKLCLGRGAIPLVSIDGGEDSCLVVFLCTLQSVRLQLPTSQKPPCDRISGPMRGSRFHHQSGCPKHILVLHRQWQLVPWKLASPNQSHNHTLASAPNLWVPSLENWSDVRHGQACLYPLEAPNSQVQTLDIHHPF